MLHIKNVVWLCMAVRDSHFTTRVTFKIYQENKIELTYVYKIVYYIKFVTSAKIQNVMLVRWRDEINIFFLNSKAIISETLKIDWHV